MNILIIPVFCFLPENQSLLELNCSIQPESLSSTGVKAKLCIVLTFGQCGHSSCDCLREYEQPKCSRKQRNGKGDNILCSIWGCAWANFC